MYLELGQRYYKWRVGLKTDWKWGMVLYAEEDGHVRYTMFCYGFFYYIRDRRMVDELIDAKNNGRLEPFLEWYDCKTEEEWFEKNKDYLKND